MIVGGSLAGATAAATLREEGFDGEVVLIGEEPHDPYERPPLSKEYLRGEAPFEKALVRSQGFWSEHAIEVRAGTRAKAIDAEGRAVALAGGERVPFDALLLATGGRNRALPVPGAGLEGVFALRTVEDADAIRAAAAGAGHAVVVGMGFIGAEVAASLRQLGLEVTVVEVFAVPLQRALGEDVGRALERVHRAHGVAMRFGDSVASIEGASRVERVVTENGARIECDLVIVGIGIVPETTICAGSGIAVDDGVLVDERCRTNVPGVFAAGDVANHLHPVFGRRMRVEHWQNAIRQGEAAARSMLGRLEGGYDDVHWFWSDQYEHTLQYAGHLVDWDELVVRGSLDDPSFVAFYVKDGLVDAAVGLDAGRDVRRTIKLIGARRPVDRAALADPDVDLRDLVAAG